MGSIREVLKKDGTVSYHAEVRIRGHADQRESFRTRTLAKKWIQDVESAIRDGRHFKTSESKKHTVADLIDRFVKEWIPKTPKYQQKKIAHLTWWKEQIGYLLLSDLTPAQIAACRDKLLNGSTCRKTQRSGGTVNRYLAAFSKPINIAIKEWGWIEENPMSRISKPKENKARERFLSEEEVQKLLEACRSSPNIYLLTIVRLALATGMRQGEIMKLRWEDVDFDAKAIVIRETKNGETKIIPITKEIEDILKSSPTFGKPLNEFIFKAIYNRRGAEIASIRYAFENAVKQAGIEGFVFHDLRRTFGSHAAMLGATQRELMELLNHKSPNMTRVYSRFNQQHLASLMERTQKKFSMEERDDQSSRN